MGPDPILNQRLKDQELYVGQTVVACWRSLTGRQSARATVVALKHRSVVVELQRAAGDHPCGYRLELPRISDFEHWSSDHGILLDRAG